MRVVWELGVIAVLLGAVLAGAACLEDGPGPGADEGPAPGEADADARVKMVRYAAEVLVPLNGRAVQVDEVTVELDGAQYIVTEPAGFAALNRYVFFELGDLALQKIDALGIDPFEVWPLCRVGISWMMDQVELSMIAMEGDPAATFTAALKLPDATSDLVTAVRLELESLEGGDAPPPGERLDPVACLGFEMDERERRGW